MRIRQVKPAFWTDPVIAGISYPARLFYIGLWGVADDGGYIDWRPQELGALLFPYEARAVRERHIATWTQELVGAGRLAVKECGCAVIPTLPEHQRISGKQTFTVKDRHLTQHRERKVAHNPGNAREVAPEHGEPNSLDVSPGRVGVGNGTVGNGSAPAGATDQDHDGATVSEFQARVARPH